MRRHGKSSSDRGQLLLPFDDPCPVATTGAASQSRPPEAPGAGRPRSAGILPASEAGRTPALQAGADGDAEARAARLFLQAARARRRDEVRRARVVFRPFRSTLYSFRIRADGTARVAFHTAFRRAPDAVLEQAAQLMLCRRRDARRRVERREYTAFVKALPPESFELPGARRAAPRARPGPGRHHSLEESFVRVNVRYFHGAMPKPQLCWSPRRSRRILGSYHERGDRVIVSRLVDSPRVPDFVVDYLMHHELLHKHLGTPCSGNGRRRLHGAEFRRLERRFERLAEAQALLRNL